jgi:hypothetical protein
VNLLNRLEKLEAEARRQLLEKPPEEMTPVELDEAVEAHIVQLCGVPLSEVTDEQLIELVGEDFWREMGMLDASGEVAR